MNFWPPIKRCCLIVFATCLQTQAATQDLVALYNSVSSLPVCNHTNVFAHTNFAEFKCKKRRIRAPISRGVLNVLDVLDVAKTNTSVFVEYCSGMSNSVPEHVKVKGDYWLSKISLYYKDNLSRDFRQIIKPLGVNPKNRAPETTG